MNINNIFSSDISLISRSQTKTTSEKLSSTVPAEPRVSESPGSIWHRLASEYDVRSMTAKETSKLSLELYKAGEISFKDHAILSFDRDAGAQGVGSAYLTKADSNGRRDMLAEFKAKVEMDKSMGNSLNLPNDLRILQHLERLDAARGGLFMLPPDPRSGARVRRSSHVGRSG